MCQKKLWKIEEGLRGKINQNGGIFTLTKCYDGRLRWLNEEGLQANPGAQVGIIDEQGNIIDKNPKYEGWDD